MLVIRLDKNISIIEEILVQIVIVKVILIILNHVVKLISSLKTTKALNLLYLENINQKRRAAE